MADSYVDDSDPEKLIQCPYDKNHQIRACRFPYHLVKCRKNHPDIVKLLMTCPFNARHQVPRAEMSQHIASCDDKRFIEQDIASQSDNYKKEPNVVSTWKPPPCEEDWDKDLDESKSVFIWGISHCEINRYYLEIQGTRGLHSIDFHRVNMADGYVYDWDPEKLIQCPYDKNHQIRACRFPYHIVKCRKNHPDIVQQLMTCPFNARHQVHREAMSQHIARCEDRTLIEQDIASQSDNYRKEPTMVNMWQPPPCEEDWDKDLEGESKSVFIWGKDRCETDRTGRIMGCKSHLHSGLRIPSSLPSVLPRKSTSQSDNYRKELNVVSARQPPPCEENWDKDLEGESKSAFVWDKNRCETDRSDTVMGYKSQLHSGLHVPSPLPSLLPWKSSAGN